MMVSGLGLGLGLGLGHLLEMGPILCVGVCSCSDVVLDW